MNAEMEGQNLKLPDLHRKSGVSLESLYKYSNGGVDNPRGDTIPNIARGLGVEAAWLATGAGPKVAQRKTMAQRPAGASPARNFDPTAVRRVLGFDEDAAGYYGNLADDGTGEDVRLPEHVAEVFSFAGEDYAPIGIYDARVSAGPGAINEEGPPVAFQLFRMAWLHSLGMMSANRLVVLRVNGDSMMETLHSGDQVLVDRGIIKMGRDGIYVLRAGASDEIQVKRLQWEADQRHISIRSDNPRYDPMPGVDPDGIEILGRVVWIGREL